MAAPDVSAAEWIAEAPSACTRSGKCRPLPLTNFGAVSFSKATATANGHSAATRHPPATARSSASRITATGAAFPVHNSNPMAA